jgi:beta-galactosidase
VAGSDHYLGELTRENAADLYLINAFMRATMRPEQPLTSLEFEVGSGDYGETGAAWQSAASARMKVLLSIAQGNRLINFYLLSGGRNPMLRHLVHDGNDRVAFTGERHGFAAPINPEGETGTHFQGLRSVTHSMRDLSKDLATAEEEHDEVVLGFFPDAYKTDFNYPGRIAEINNHLQAVREPLESISRTLLRLGFRYPAVDVENGLLDTKRVLVIAVPRYLSCATQTKLAGFVRSGGRLLIYGDFPIRDEAGQPCLALADALGVTPLEPVSADGEFHLSFSATGWAVGKPEVRSYRAIPFAKTDGVFLHTADSGHAVGFEAHLGQGRCTVISGNIPAHLSFFHHVLERLGAKPAIQCHDATGGTWVTTMKSRNGHRFACVINLDHEAKDLRWEENEKAMTHHLPKRIPGRFAEILRI